MVNMLLHLINYNPMMQYDQLHAATMAWMDVESGVIVGEFVH
jgi:hypothetical protein